MDTALEEAESLEDIEVLDVPLAPQEIEIEDLDEILDDTAQGHGLTSEARGAGTGEIDAIGKAAGLVVKEGKPLRGVDEVERRDQHRWEQEAPPE